MDSCPCQILGKKKIDQLKNKNKNTEFKLLVSVVTHMNKKYNIMWFFFLGGNNVVAFYVTFKMFVSEVNWLVNERFQ